MGTLEQLVTEHGNGVVIRGQGLWAEGLVDVPGSSNNSCLARK